MAGGFQLTNPNTKCFTEELSIHFKNTISLFKHILRLKMEKQKKKINK